MDACAALRLVRTLKDPLELLEFDHPCADRTRRVTTTCSRCYLLPLCPLSLLAARCSLLSLTLARANSHALPPLQQSAPLPSASNSSNNSSTSPLLAASPMSSPSSLIIWSTSCFSSSPSPSCPRREPHQAEGSTIHSSLLTPSRPPCWARMQTWRGYPQSGSRSNPRHCAAGSTHVLDPPPSTPE